MPSLIPYAAAFERETCRLARGETPSRRNGNGTAG